MDYYSGVWRHSFNLGGTTPKTSGIYIKISKESEEVLGHEEVKRFVRCIYYLKANGLMPFCNTVHMTAFNRRIRTTGTAKNRTGLMILRFSSRWIKRFAEKECSLKYERDEIMVKMLATLLHEARHFQQQEQFHDVYDFDRAYGAETKNHGYQNNQYEVDARAYALDNIHHLYEFVYKLDLPNQKEN